MPEAELPANLSTGKKMLDSARDLRMKVISDLSGTTSVRITVKFA